MAPGLVGSIVMAEAGRVRWGACRGGLSPVSLLGELKDAAQ